MSDVENLHKLAELKEKGLLTQEEFNKKKAEIFAGSVGHKKAGSAEAKRRGLWWKFPLIVFVMIPIFLGLLTGENDGSRTSAVVNNTSGSGPSQIRVSPYEHMRAMMPAGQIAMIDVVETARRQYAAGANEMAKGASRPFRAQALCSVLPNRVVNGWVGRVANLSTNGDGKGVLAIEIGRDISVKTWNNGFSDISDNTLIEPNSPLFGVAAQLKRGQFVRFSGQFFKSDVDCIRESSVSLSGSVEKPDFVFRLQSVTPIDG